MRRLLAITPLGPVPLTSLASAGHDILTVVTFERGFVITPGTVPGQVDVEHIRLDHQEDTAGERLTREQPLIAIDH